MLEVHKTILKTIKHYYNQTEEKQQKSPYKKEEACKNQMSLKGLSTQKACLNKMSSDRARNSPRREQFLK